MFCHVIGVLFSEDSDYGPSKGAVSSDGFAFPALSNFAASPRRDVSAPQEHFDPPFGLVESKAVEVRVGGEVVFGGRHIGGSRQDGAHDGVVYVVVVGAVEACDFEGDVSSSRSGCGVDGGDGDVTVSLL